jgi:hypothetical protein
VKPSPRDHSVDSATSAQPPEAFAAATPRTFWYDVASGVLYLAAAESLFGLVGFIARERLGAAVEWIGLIHSAAYMGFAWNLFLSRLTALVSLRRSMLVIMTISGLIIGLGALQRTAAGFSLLVVLFLLAYGLFNVQYNTLVGHLYTQEQRPRLVSRRYLAVSAVSIGEVALFGWMSKGSIGHTPAFLLGGALMIAGAVVFRSIPTTAEYRMEPFRTRDVARAALGDPAFRRLAAVLTFYGWVGAGISPALVLLYQRSGFREDSVGLLAGAKTVGLLFGLFAITPRMKFAGGLTNFRLSFVTALASVSCYCTAAFLEVGPWSFAIIAVGQFLFGISTGGFNIANATTGANLGRGAQTTLYVNALMIVLGLRGIVMPMAVSMFLRWAGLGSALVASLGVCVVCSLISVLPGIDAMAHRSTPEREPEAPARAAP